MEGEFRLHRGRCGSKTKRVELVRGGILHMQDAHKADGKTEILHLIAAKRIWKSELLPLSKSSPNIFIEMMGGETYKLECQMGDIINRDLWMQLIQGFPQAASAAEVAIAVPVQHAVQICVQHICTNRMLLLYLLHRLYQPNVVVLGSWLRAMGPVAVDDPSRVYLHDLLRNNKLSEKCIPHDSFRMLRLLVELFPGPMLGRQGGDILNDIMQSPNIADVTKMEALVKSMAPTNRTCLKEFLRFYEALKNQANGDMTQPDIEIKFEMIFRRAFTDDDECDLRPILESFIQQFGTLFPETVAEEHGPAEGVQSEIQMIDLLHALIMKATNDIRSKMKSIEENVMQELNGLVATCKKHRDEVEMVQRNFDKGENRQASIVEE